MKKFILMSSIVSFFGFLSFSVLACDCDQLGPYFPIKNAIKEALQERNLHQDSRRPMIFLSFKPSLEDHENIERDGRSSSCVKKDRSFHYVSECSEKRQEYWKVFLKFRCQAELLVTRTRTSTSAKITYYTCASPLPF
jgi:hypothetical protein